MTLLGFIIMVALGFAFPTILVLAVERPVDWRTLREAYAIVLLIVGIAIGVAMLLYALHLVG